MSRRRQRDVAADLHHLAQAATAAAVVAEGASKATEKAQVATEKASEVVEQVAAAGRKRGRKGLLLVVLVALVGAGFFAWKRSKRSGGSSPAQSSSDAGPATTSVQSSSPSANGASDGEADSDTDIDVRAGT